MSNMKKTLHHDKTFKYVFYEIYTWISWFYQKIPESNFVWKFLIGTKQYIHTNFVFSSLEWRVYFSFL